MINRGAIILRPAQPFIDWAAGLDDSGLVPSAEGEQHAYLVPEWEDDREQERVLKKVFAELFERELFGWHMVEEDWPRDRSLREFLRWFHIEMHSLVIDVCQEPLLREEE